MYLTIKQFVIIIFILLNLTGVNAQNQTKKFKNYYENGVLKLKGAKKNEINVGTWYYYSEKGFITKKERWKKGVLKLTIKYNEKQKVSELIDENGKIKKINGCGC